MPKNPDWFGLKSLIELWIQKLFSFPWHKSLEEGLTIKQKPQSSTPSSKITHAINWLVYLPLKRNWGINRTFSRVRWLNKWTDLIQATETVIPFGTVTTESIDGFEDWKKVRE